MKKHSILLLLIVFAFSIFAAVAHAESEDELWVVVDPGHEIGRAHV